MQPKAKKQSARDLITRYARETLGSEVDINPVPTNEAFNRLAKNINRVIFLPTDLLVIEDNVRKILDLESEDFFSLVDSVRSNGVRQSIIVDLREGGDAGFMLLVLAGQRRVLAARRAGVTEIACLLLQTKGKAEQVAVGLAENILRENLHPLDLADAYLSLVTEGWSTEEVSEQFERGKQTIEKYLRLARFPEAAKAIIRANRHRFNSFVLFQKFVGKKWKTDADLVKGLNSFLEATKKNTRKNQMSEEGRPLVEAITRHPGLACKMKGTSESGELTIKYSSKEQFELLLGLFGNG